MKKKLSEKLKLVVLFTALLCALTAGAGGFDITINDSSEMDAPWPLIASIPFPEGELKDISAVRIMSGKREVPSQVDVAATWRDGSVRWAHAGFTASPRGAYRVEYGEGVGRSAYSHPLQVNRRADGGFTVDTGAALYSFERDRLLPEQAWLVSGSRRTLFLDGAGAGAYLVDNAGKTARVAGEEAEIQTEFIKEGPGRLVLKRSGWYVNGAGEKPAWADVWMYFAAGTPYVRITHSLIFTEDTNKTWFKDYGLEFKTPSAPADVYCTIGPPGKVKIMKVPAEGSEVYQMQDTYPHFAEREYRALIGKGGKIIEEFETAGDWAHGDYGSYGITVAMPWLAERFPKEISFGERGARAVLWSGRSGRELDFRVKTLVKEYFQEWAMWGLQNPADSELEAVKTNAQGAARTHDIWFLPHPGPYNGEKVKQAGTAAARPPLAMADPVWLCETEAVGNYPMLHRDVERFPAEEAMLSEFWERFIIPLKAFPMNGFISWGCYPDRSYSYGGTKTVMSQFHALSNLREYGVRREPWRLYARSQEREYYEYGHRFSRFTGDWYLAHRDAPLKKKGEFTTSSGGRGRSGKLPLFWGETSHPYVINAGDIGHWLLDYYLTGDERSFELLHMIRETFRKNDWVPGGKPSHFHALGIRTLLTLFIMDWDEEAGSVARRIVNEMVDLESQNGFCLFEAKFGPMYKDHRTSHNILEYYLETGDELAKEAFLKLIDQRYRFDRRYRPIGYKNYDGFTYSIAYWMTGNERYRAVVEQTVRDLLYYTQALPLSEELAVRPENPLEWVNLLNNVPNFPGPRRGFYMGHHEYHNAFIGLPTALKFLAKEGWKGKTTPLVVKAMQQPPSMIIFSHGEGRETLLNLYVQTHRYKTPPEWKVFSYLEGTVGKKPVSGVKAEFEQRMPMGKYFLQRPGGYTGYIDGEHYNAVITVPPEIPGGLYLFCLGEDTTFTLLDASADKTALYCPEGFWSPCVGEHITAQYGRPGEGRPAFFKVPRGLEELDILIARPVRLKAPDGSVVVEMLNENIGRMKIPVKGRSGIWSIEYHIRSFRGSSPPAFVKLYNVEPVVAFGFPSFLPDISGERMLPEPAAAAHGESPLEFVDGINGLAVRLSGGKTLAFDTGGEITGGGSAYFPRGEGTVEFWFRPGISTWETPVAMTGENEQVFLKATHLRLLHRYFARITEMDVESHLRLELIPGKSGAPPAGLQAEHYFREGEWTHLAFTWALKESSSGTEGSLAIFINGKRQPHASSRFGLKPFKGGAFIPGKEGKEVVVGPFEGAVDMLRISDNVRYAGDFIPSKKVPSSDANTRALFLFDGSLEGYSSFSSKPAELR